MPRKPVIAIIDTNKEQFKYCQESLPKYRCLALFMVEGLVDMTSLPAQVEVMLVYAGKTQQETSEICQQIRCNSCTVNMPILLVVDRYDVTQSSIATQTDKADVILAPFKSEEL
ncbi:MAG: hypothetical protein HQ515_09695, partial [Phycisphaeraceae bacterium]|nr:hypothetical protein [Phycisphaeraceae bacterium]